MFKVALRAARPARNALMVPQKQLFRGMATKYSKSHEYLIMDGDIGTVGITGHAADALGDVVYVDLPSVGDEFGAGDSFGSVESVKAASDVYLPVAGEIVEVNEALENEPGTVNSSPMENGWFVKIKVTDDSAMGDLLDDAAYSAHCDEA